MLAQTHAVDVTLRPPATESGRHDKELIAATRPFAVDDPRRSGLHLAVALALTAASVFVGSRHLGYPYRLLAALVEGLLIVRLFIIYHDFMHGSVLRRSRLASWVLHSYGILVLVPPRIWRESHNYHHAHTAKIAGSSIGSFPMVSVEIWKRMMPLQRLGYRIARHPLTILVGYVPLFMLGMCLASFARNPRKYWDSALALFVHLALAVGLIHWAGAATFVFVLLLPLVVACALGGYLFYAQHNFPGVRVQPRQAWSYVSAALTSSSYMSMSPLMSFFAGNIGLHHIHHLNPSIPFYRLPEVMRAVPELDRPADTSLSPRDVWRCLSLKLWDAQRGCMVGYPDT
jgi:omega-6 fatty acid desaturase (delta-12 desaturase)